MNEKIVILFRHGESEINAHRKRIAENPISVVRTKIKHFIDPGLDDSVLTAAGREQVYEGGVRLARDILAHKLPPVELVGVSPLKRALATCTTLMHAASRVFTNWCQSDSLTHKLRQSFSIEHFELHGKSDISAESCYRSMYLQRSPIDIPVSEIESPATDKPILFIIPFLRERVTTSADKLTYSCDEARKYLEGFTDPVGLATTSMALPSRISSRSQLYNFLTIDLTRRQRRCDVETLNELYK